MGRFLKIQLLIPMASPQPRAQPTVATSYCPAADPTERLGLRCPAAGSRGAPDHQAHRPEDKRRDDDDGQEPHEDAVRVEACGHPWKPTGVLEVPGEMYTAGHHHARDVYEDAETIQNRVTEMPLLRLALRIDVWKHTIAAGESRSYGGRNGWEIAGVGIAKSEWEESCLVIPRMALSPTLTTNGSIWT
ncbi:hypothetical protein VP1G_11382 [Cytospora mali]|uniref:Uncharacterized protein n=1 Tax=Cytospora mali TaxID=578113 RepID=A0A194VE04_CYTMA|nr:hypothetical protein VP1G_11382 [Valsa mali var. pyri (nom. inval.)]